MGRKSIKEDKNIYFRKNRRETTEHFSGLCSNCTDFRNVSNCPGRFFRMNELGWMFKEHPTVQVEHLPLTAPVYHGIKNGR